MMNDDDFLDRALAALPLEDPPASLHARVMSATVYRPRAAVQQWEIWLLATFSALAIWLSWVVLSSPRIAERLTDSTTPSLSEPEKCIATANIAAPAAARIAGRTQAGR